MSFHNNKPTKRHREFEKALKKDPFDYTTRNVYADCLEEDGEYEESQRQRQWIDSFEWIYGTIKGECWYKKNDYDNSIETKDDGLEFINDFVDNQLLDDCPITYGFDQPDEWRNRDKLNSCLEIVTGKRLTDKQKEIYIGCSC